MRFWGRVKRFFRSRQLIVVFDATHWHLEIPARAVLYEVAQRGELIFMSIDLSDVPRSQKVMFSHLPPEKALLEAPAKPPPTTLKPWGSPQA